MANSELRTANEQLLINAEEAASSHEEVETLNEEMQATNEELETLNEELQATVEELNTTNDELQSRSGDLERSSAMREARLSRIATERDALAKVIETRGELILIADQKGNVLYASRALESDPVVKSLGGLNSNKKVKLLDGSAVAASAREIELDGQKLRVLTFSAET
jgi:two-component system CheB/CheR fusion protein